MTLRTIPTDIYEILHELLDLDAIASLYATMDKRVQTMLLLSKPSRYVEVQPIYRGTSWHVLYYLKQLKGIERLTLKQGAGLSLSGMKSLAALNPTQLCLYRSSLVASNLKDLPFAFRNQVGKPVPSLPTENFDSSLCRELHRIGAHFPKLTSLTLYSPIVSIVDHESLRADTEEKAVTAFLESLPPSLLYLNCENLSQTFGPSLPHLTLPPTLTDLRIKSKWNSSLCLFHVVERLPVIRVLHLHLTTSQYRSYFGWRAHIDDYELPKTLKEISLLIAANEVPSLSNERIFPWSTSAIETLILHYAPPVSSSFLPLELKIKMNFPPTLLNLTISQPLLASGTKVALLFEHFPTTLQVLDLGACIGDAELFSKITVLPNLQVLKAQPRLNPADDHVAWIFPGSLTSLELREFVLTKNQLLRLPIGMKKLRCSVQFVEDMFDFLNRCTSATLHCDSPVYLATLNMPQILKFGLENDPHLTSYKIIRSLYNHLGPRCIVELQFDAAVFRTATENRLLLSEKNTSLVVDSNPIVVDGYSLSAHRFSMILTSRCQFLTHLEFHSFAEISSLKFIPPNLTALNIRHSPIKSKISLKDAPISLTSFTALFEPQTAIRVDDLPTTKQFRVLNTPWLVYTMQDIETGLSDELEVLNGVLSWTYDREVQKLVNRWKNAKFSLGLVSRVTGSLLPDTAEIVNYDILSSSSVSALRSLGCTRGIEVLPPATIAIPPSVTSIDLLPTDLSKCSNFVGFENAILPSTLTELSVHFVREVKKLFPALPSSLLHLSISSPSLVSDYIGPFPPHLETLSIASTTLPTLSARKVPVPFVLFPRSLRTLRLSNCALIIEDATNSPNLLGRMLSKLKWRETESNSIPAPEPFPLLQRIVVHRLPEPQEKSLLALCPYAEPEWLAALPDSDFAPVERSKKRLGALFHYPN